MKTTHIHNIPLANPIVSYLINLIHNYKTPIHLHTQPLYNHKLTRTYSFPYPHSPTKNTAPSSPHKV